MLTLTKTTAAEKRSLEAECNAHKKTALKLDTVIKMLIFFLEDFEGSWNGECEYELGQHYIECATWIQRHTGRAHNIIDEVKEHIYTQPDPREGMTFHQFANYPKQP